MSCRHLGVIRQDDPAGETVMRLEVDPRDSLADAPLSVRVVDAPADQAITLTATVTDAAGQRWQSHGVFHADADGIVDVVRDAPASGTYDGVDPGGLIWSMRFAGARTPGRLFTASAGYLDITYSAEPDAGTAVATRRWRGAGVTRSKVRGEGFVAFLFEPAGEGRHPAVAVFHGTTGARAMEPMAALLASHGYAAMVVGYMGIDGLPAALCEIPLETLAAGLRWLATHPRVDPERVSVLGASVGAAGALAMLAEVPGLEVRVVVAISPSSVVWQAVADGRPPQKSSWSLDGKPLPYLPIRGERLLPQLIKHALLKRLSRHARSRALRLLPTYAASLRDRQAVERAAIRVERIAAPILFVAGDDDQMWPAAAMLDALRLRRRGRGHEQADRFLRFADAGHIIRPPIVPTTITWTEALHSGGTPAGCARASATAWEAILAFLGKHLVRR